MVHAGLVGNGIEKDANGVMAVILWGMGGFLVVFGGSKEK